MLLQGLEATLKGARAGRRLANAFSLDMPHVCHLLQISALEAAEKQFLQYNPCTSVQENTTAAHRGASHSLLFWFRQIDLAWAGLRTCASMLLRSQTLNLLVCQQGNTHLSISENSCE